MSSFFRKLKESLKFSIAPQKYVHDKAKEAGVSDSLFVKQQIQKAQKYSPGSKYLGFSGIPGLESQKELKAKAEDAEQATFTAMSSANAAATATETAAQAKAKQDQQTQLAARRRNQLFSYGVNRTSLGGVGSMPTGGQKTLLGY
jgi:hypothetical protein